MIERRIRRGDYLLRPIPSERKLAAEIGVSHMTARKAVKELLDRNVLSRQPNGNLQISPDYHADAGAGQVVLLYPAFASAYLSHLCQVVSTAAEAYGLSTRPVPYVHWDDPIVLTATNNPGGVIVIPSSLDIPAHILAVLQSNRVVSLDLDLSDRQVPSIRLFSDAHIVSVLDHLLKLGHHHIDCISTHTHNPEIQRRIQLWSDWTYRNGVAGELHERAAPTFTDPTPYAFEEMSAVLRKSPVKATCFVATTFPAAVGAIRACWEQKRAVRRGLIGVRDEHRSARAVHDAVDHGARHARLVESSAALLRLVHERKNPGPAHCGWSRPSRCCSKANRPIGRSVRPNVFDRLPKFDITNLFYLPAVKSSVERETSMRICTIARRAIVVGIGFILASTAIADDHPFAHPPGLGGRSNDVRG